jgi:iron(III) transport system permease protein
MQPAEAAVRHNHYGIALAYCTTLIVLMSLIIGFIQWAVGERKLGRRKTPPAATLVVGA